MSEKVIKMKRWICYKFYSGMPYETTAHFTKIGAFLSGIFSLIFSCKCVSFEIERQSEEE